MPPSLKVAVLVDDMQVSRFARDTLDAIAGCDEISVFSCTNSRSSRNALKHGGYYALSLAAVRNPLSRSVPVAGGRKRVAAATSFESEYEGAWQSLPGAVVRQLAEGGYDVIVKFGLGLMRVPPMERLPVPILSYHHGDPERYRGRPAGFYETLEGAPSMGQIVQQLSNKLDAGKVLAFAETKVFPHSYRATLMEAYRHSPLIINEAIERAISGVAVAKEARGRNYRLPSNVTTLKFVLRMAARFVGRLFYGAFFEKAWQVSTTPIAPEAVARLVYGEAFPPPQCWETVPLRKPYVFYADPFFSEDPPGLLVEGLNARTGLGEIVHIAGSEHKRISPGGGHYSYPFPFRNGGKQILVPEIATWAAPAGYTIDEQGMKPALRLRVEGGRTILDPTLIEHQGRIYLFGNCRETGVNALQLWSAETLQDEFKRHPASPIRISPRGARMGGALVRTETGLYRLGQDFLSGYGDGIFAFEVLELGPGAYEERMTGAIRFTDRHGPHTLNFRPGEATFDWYVDRFSPLAGVRRVLSRLRSRPSPSDEAV